MYQQLEKLIKYQPTSSEEKRSRRGHRTLVEDKVMNEKMHPMTYH